MRASYYLLGALLGKYHHAEVALPGGCNIGSRPIDQHLKGFRALGATGKISNGMIIVDAKKLVGARIYFDKVSVGATINVMLAATLAEGRTVLENVAKEPHIVDVANMLNSMGANIKGAGTDVIRIEGVKKLHGAYRFMMNVMVKTAGKGLANKTDRTSEEDDMLDMMVNGGKRVSLQNLKAVTEWYKSLN